MELEASRFARRLRQQERTPGCTLQLPWIQGSETGWFALWMHSARKVALVFKPRRSLEILQVNK
eukprot:584559-Alexandrium_andersonii.AAC.1